MMKVFKPYMRQSQTYKERMAEFDDTLSMHSFQVFNEDNMDPLNTTKLQEPRRNFDCPNLFHGLINDEGEIFNYENPSLSADHPEDMLEKEAIEGSGQQLNLLTSVMDYWMLLGQLHYFTEGQKKQLEGKFPTTFFALLQNCAQIIGVEWSVVYDQLQTLEIIFNYGIKKFDKDQQFVSMRYLDPIKDINMLLNWHRDLF